MSNWIPTSERLPDKEGEYLVTHKTLKDSVIRVLYFSFAKDGPGWYVYDEDLRDLEKANVLAWQDLPKPYKETRYRIRHKWLYMNNYLAFYSNYQQYLMVEVSIDTQTIQGSFTWAEIEEIKHKTGTDFNDKDWEIIEVKEDEKD